MRELLNGRDVEEEDVQDILCGPDANTLSDDIRQRERLMAIALLQNNAFITMINKIIKSKEEDERAREREHRAQNVDGH